MADNTINPELPPWFASAQPFLNFQESLFKVALELVLVQTKVSPDELNRWYANRWISFAFAPIKLNDQDDPKILELLFVRDVVRSGLTDAQITALFDQCSKPHSFDPTRTAFSFRYGLVQVMPAEEPDEPATVIEANLDDWIDDCDEDRLVALHDQIAERIKTLRNENL